MDIQTLTAIRQALSALPPLAAFSTGSKLDPSQIYFPYNHAEALDPDVTLVVGNRGMGKSFWASALAQDDTKAIISEAYRLSSLTNLKNVNVFFAFADAEGGAGGISRAQIESVPDNFSSDLIWRAVILKKLANVIGAAVPSKFNDLVRWMRENIDEQQLIFHRADQILTDRGEKILFLFDQLDQLGTNWKRIQELTQGMLRLALAVRSYRSIRIKIFMRPDQAENRDLFRFPDASKVSGSRIRLRWRPTDLYGLLFFKIFNHQDGKIALMDLCKEIGIPINVMNNRHLVPLHLSVWPETQQKIFDVIAGPFMGASKKRGATYTWIPAHIADAQGEVSPRSFLKVLKTAADHVPIPVDTAIDFSGIQEGVREASENRLSELQEDYPWVSMTLDPLRRLLVPCDREEIYSRWHEAKVVENILRRFEGTSSPLSLGELHHLGGYFSFDLLVENLSEIGVIEVRPNGKLNVPDIFRVNAGILRKGGITPQQRRTFYG